jgi:hypothetical protein
MSITSDSPPRWRPMSDCTCTIDVTGVPSSAAIASPGATPANAPDDPADTADTTTAPAAMVAHAYRPIIP